MATVCREVCWPQSSVIRSRGMNHGDTEKRSGEDLARGFVCELPYESDVAGIDRGSVRNSDGRLTTNRIRVRISPNLSYSVPPCLRGSFPLSSPCRRRAPARVGHWLGVMTDSGSSRFSTSI